MRESTVAPDAMAKLESLSALRTYTPRHNLSFRWCRNAVDNSGPMKTRRAPRMTLELPCGIIIASPRF
jgi:hypothetical protein